MAAEETQESAQAYQNPVTRMFQRAFSSVGGTINEKATEQFIRVANSEPVQEKGAAAINWGTETLVQKVIPDQLRQSYKEIKDENLNTYQAIRSKIALRPDGKSLGFWKELTAIGLTLCVKIGSLIGGGFLGEYTREDQNEVKNYPTYIEAILASLFGRPVKQSPLAA